MIHFQIRTLALKSSPEAVETLILDMGVTVTNDAPLVDVSKVSFEVLTDEDNQVIVKSMKRLVDSLDDPDGIISAFNSFASVE